MSQAGFVTMDAPRSNLGWSDAVRVLVAPTDVYKKVEDTAAYGWALAGLLIAVGLLGFVQIQTGLIDRVVDLQVQKNKADFEATHANVDRARFQDGLEDIVKEGEFLKTIRYLDVGLLAPAGMLASYLLISATMYALVALSGRKPEFQTLMSICVYAGFVDLLARLLCVGMMIAYRTAYVDTSLAMLAVPGEGTVLAAINPFVVWFWVLVAIGLMVTRQLGRRTAIAASAVLCVCSLGGHVAMTFAQI